MSELSDYRITDEDVAQNGVIAAPDRLTGTAAQNKAVFDRLIRDAVKERYNAMLTAVEAHLVWEPYDAEKTYVPGNKVVYNGSSYLCTEECAGVLPTAAACWRLVAARGADGTGAGDMRREFYDPRGVETDVFAYVDERTDTYSRAETLSGETARMLALSEGAVPDEAFRTIMHPCVTVSVTEKGQPVQDAEVTASLGEKTVRAITGEDGAAPLTLPGYGDWEICPSKEGYVSYPSHLKVDSVRIYEEIPLFLFSDDNLPDGYTRLKYLQSTGTQYIDTGIGGNKGYSYNIFVCSDSEPVSFGLATDYVMGSNANYGNSLCLWFTEIGHVTWRSGSFNGGLDGVDVAEFAFYVCSNDSCSRNGVSISCSTGATQIGSPFYLFSGGRDRMANCKIGYYEVFDGSGTIQKMYPCRHDSDGILGMYDTVSGTFFTNVGTDAFIAGPEV